MVVEFYHWSLGIGHFLRLCWSYEVTSIQLYISYSHSTPHVYISYELPCSIKKRSEPEVNQIVLRPVLFVLNTTTTQQHGRKEGCCVDVKVDRDQW